MSSLLFWQRISYTHQQSLRAIIQTSVLESHSLNLWYRIFAVSSQILPNSLRLVWAPTDTKGVLFLNEWAPLLRSNLKKLVKMNLVYFTVCLRYSLLSDANKLYTSRGNIRHSMNHTWVHLSSKLRPRKRIVNRIRERDDSKLKFRSRKALLLKMTSLKTFHNSKVGCEEFKEETSNPQGNKMRFSMATPLNPNASSQIQLKTISF